MKPIIRQGSEKIAENNNKFMNSFLWVMEKTENIYRKLLVPQRMNNAL